MTTETEFHELTIPTRPVLVTGGLGSRGLIADPSETPLRTPDVDWRA